ncbi:hypothetical protein [Streptomyces orinoci]|uniref:Integral membrane protein n=1 Tax=Streptomyces orinoci TaxID=67339 RepID=A0ABV3K1S7_STRON|nr:hypothetical protein [Streptomyces orinoci]
MPHPVARAGADLRLIRAAVFTAVCVVLSAGGHALASGMSVPLWALAAGGLGVFAVAAPLAGRERSLPGIAAALALGQLALHALFGLGQRGMPAPRPADGPLAGFAGRLLCNQHPGLSPDQARRVITDAGLDPMTHPGTAAMPAPAGHDTLGHLLPLSPQMLLGHLLAALALGWLLRRGEAALWRLVRLSARGIAEVAPARALRAALALIRTLLGPGAEEPAAPVRRGERRERRPAREPELQHFVIRRGPPRPVLAA